MIGHCLSLAESGHGAVITLRNPEARVFFCRNLINWPRMPLTFIGYIEALWVDAMPWSKPTASTTARGYGARHQQIRKQWLPVVAAGGVICWRCRKAIHPWMEWELGHDHWNRGVHRGPEHKACNRKAADARLS